MHSGKYSGRSNSFSAENYFINQILPTTKTSKTQPPTQTSEKEKEKVKEKDKKREFPFNPEEYQLKLPPWYTDKDSMEIPSISNGYVIIQDNRSSEETGGTAAIQTTTTTTTSTNQKTNFNLEIPYIGSMINPKIFFNIQTHMEIQYIVNKTAEKNSEVALYQLIFPMNQFLDFYCSDFILMGQDASGASVDIDGDHHDKILNYLSTEYKDLLGPNVWSYLHHAHSHPNMGVGRSGTDKNNEETRSQQGYKAPARFFTIYNNRGEISTRYFQYPHGSVKIPIQEFKNVSLGVHIPQGSAVKLTKERMEELDQLIKKYVVTKSVSYHNSSLFPSVPSSVPTFKQNNQTKWENTYKPRNKPDADFFSEHPAVVSDYLGHEDLSDNIELADIADNTLELITEVTRFMHPHGVSTLGKRLPEVDKALKTYYSSVSTYSGELPSLVQMCSDEDEPEQNYYGMRIEYLLKKYGEAFSHWYTTSQSKEKPTSKNIEASFLNSLYLFEFVAEDLLSNSFFKTDYVEEEIDPKNNLFPLYLVLSNNETLSSLLGEKVKDQFITKLLTV